MRGGEAVHGQPWQHKVGISSAELLIRLQGCRDEAREMVFARIRERPGVEVEVHVRPPFDA